MLNSPHGRVVAACPHVVSYGDDERRPGSMAIREDGTAWFLPHDSVDWQHWPPVPQYTTEEGADRVTPAGAAS